MATAVKQQFDTMGEVLKRLGGIDPDRVRLSPPPGTATERDLLELLARQDRLYELVEGTLVEKGMGSPEANVAGELLFHLRLYLTQNNLGFVLGADGLLRLGSRTVRGPDLSFISWDRVPVRGTMPGTPITDLPPDLAVEVLSRTNTRREMDRKLKEYFDAGSQHVWYIDPPKRSVMVYTAPNQATVLREDDTLTGGELLPGFSVPVRQLFAQLPPPKKRRKR